MHCAIIIGGAPAVRVALEGTMFVDATLKHKMSLFALPAEKFMSRAKGNLEEPGLPRLVPQAPWHGYHLGDWTDDWSSFAEAVVRGDWRSNGIEAFGRRQGGIKPETSVRNVGEGHSE
jgi:hypothetical protein